MGMYGGRNNHTIEKKYQHFGSIWIVLFINFLWEYFLNTFAKCIFVFPTNFLLYISFFTIHLILPVFLFQENLRISI